LATSEQALAQLKEFDPGAAAKLAGQLASTQAAADKEVAALRAEREKLVADRDAARTLVQKLTQDNTRLTQENTTLRQNPPRGAQQQAAPPGRSISVPNVVGRQAGEGERILGSAGFLTTTRFVDSDQARGQVVDQLPNAGTQLVSGATVSLSLASGPPPALTRGAQDETQQILRVLQRYKSAYESLDAKAVAAINPSMDVARLQTAFSQFSQMSYDLLVHVDGVSIDGSTATVTATETIRPTSRSVRANPTTTTAVFTLRRAGTSWTIQSISNRR
jgi:beta-lactam-binding protein with PASTA domain